MKIQIIGTYSKRNQYWIVRIPALEIEVEGKNPFLAFKGLQELIDREIGIRVECTFRISDVGCFELLVGSSREFISFIARKIDSRNDFQIIISDIRFQGELGED